MMEFLRFTFESVWHFAGVFLLLCVVGQVIVAALGAITAAAVAAVARRGGR